MEIWIREALIKVETPGHIQDTVQSRVDGS